MFGFLRKVVTIGNEWSLKGSENEYDAVVRCNSVICWSSCGVHSNALGVEVVHVFGLMEP